MITFLDENDVEYGALATIKATNAVNGERSLTGTIVSGDYVLSNIERGWRLRFDDEYYVVTYAKPVDEGRDVQVEFDAVHQFFWDFDKSSVYDQLADGSHTFVAYLDFIFKNSGYSYTVDSALNVYAFEKQSFGFKKRLTLFNDIITSTGVEFQVNGKVVRILEKVGTDLSTVVRKNFNMNELTIEKNIGDFVTYQKGFGAYFDEEDHSKGRLEVEYTSPLASVYGKLEAEPFVDERYSQSSSLLAVLKENVDNSYTISVSLDMEDLTRAGYKYKQPIAGDYIMAINETLDFQEKIRIVSFTSEYDVDGQLIKHTVTCNDIGSVKKLSASYTHTQHQAANAEANANTAYEYANKALISADGKNTNYYGDSFPVDNPKGTLKKGDLLFLTVGDTVKQYYWNGADWVINPVLDDVEAFKEQIAEELKDVPDREEFENKISEELANSKAEIATQIETAKTQAESNAKEYADTINQETAKVAELANAAADEIKADLVNVKNNLTDTSLIANNAQAAVDAAKQELTEVANELSATKQDLTSSVAEVNTKVNSAKAEITQAKQDLISHAQQLQTQANAQTELSKRVTTVETTANGTKTTVSELSKTVAQNGKDITSVTERTKVVEDDLSGTKTTLSQVKMTADSTSQKTATLETGLDGLTANFNSLSVGNKNYLPASRVVNRGCSNFSYSNTTKSWTMTAPASSSAFGNGITFNTKGLDILLNGGETLFFGLMIKANKACSFKYDVNNALSGTTSNDNDNTSKRAHSPSNKSIPANIWTKVWFSYTAKANVAITENNSNFGIVNNTEPVTIEIKEVMVAKSNVPVDYQMPDAELEQKVAEYKQNADQNYASLQTTVQNLDGTVQHNKTVADQTAQGFTTRIESLETYKNGESERANAYFESAKTETAKQLTAERTAIAKDYVAKSTYTSDVTGIRNELSATASTANATKTNLANYQASNDKVVASLKSSLQTTDGNVSNLQTKVEAVPGQITSAVSAVEGKIPTSAGGRNLALGTSGDWSGDWTNFNGQNNQTRTIYRIYNRGLKNGDKVNVRLVLKYSDIVAADGQTAKISPQFPGNVTEWGAGGLNGGQPVYLSPDDNEVVLSGTTTITDDYLRNDYWEWGLRVDYVASGRIQWKEAKADVGDLPTPWSPAPEDTASQISSLSSQIQQTADGMTLLATKTELNNAKTELQSSINTATNKANNNAQTITTHTNQISALNTGLSAKVSQSDFNTLSGRVTTAENNITAKANELSSKITSVEGKILASVRGRNLWIQSKATGNFVEETLPDNHVTGQRKCYRIPNYQQLEFNIEPDFSPRLYQKVTFSAWVKYENVVQGENRWNKFNCFKHSLDLKNSITGATTGSSPLTLDDFTGTSDWKRITYTYDYAANKSYDQLKTSLRFNLEGTRSGTAWVTGVKVEIGSIPSDYSPAPEDTAEQISSLSSEFKQTTDAIKASVSSLDNSTIKSSSLTINSDGIVMKAGKSTTDVANAIGSYFAVNQNAINLFSDKINVKGNMIVNGAITSDKIASKSINTSHLNGKIITADVISSNAVTAGAIKAGAVTTDKMSANSINGDRITAGTLDAAKIKAGSITASQIASGTITSNQIKAGGISSANIAAGAITGDKIAAGAIDANKIAANAITANMIRGGKLNSTNGATSFDLNAGTLTFNNDYGYIQRVSSDKVFEITTVLGKDAESRDFLTSDFTIRKSDFSRQAGAKFTLYSMGNNKPTARATIHADELVLFDSQNTTLLSILSKGSFSNFNFQDWGDIPVAQLPGVGLMVKDIGIGGHTKSLLKIVEELCKKTGILWF